MNMTRVADFYNFEPVVALDNFSDELPYGVDPLAGSGATIARSVARMDRDPDMDSPQGEALLLGVTSYS